MMPSSSIYHDPTLQVGTIEALFKDDKSHPSFTTPRLQIIHLKKLSGPVPSGPNSGAIQDRYRVIFSDGLAYFQGMLAANLNALVEDGRVGINSIVTLKKFTCSLVKERKILIVLDIYSEKTLNIDHKIGNPSNIEELVSGKIPEVLQNKLELPSKVSENLQDPPINTSRKMTTEKPPSYNQISNSHTLTPSATGIPQPTSSPLHFKPLENSSKVSLYDSEETIDYTPIASLSPYNNRWTIKARCTSKQDIRVFTNARGQGKVFSVTLMDSSGEIRATAFNDAVTQFYPIFEVGRVYCITKGQIKIAKKVFGSNLSTPNNPYDMSLEKETLVKPLLGLEASSVPLPSFSIIPIINILDQPKDSFIDVVGVVTEISPISTIIAKATGKQLTRRDITIVDSSNAAIRVTLWGKQAEEAEGPSWTCEPVLAIKGAKVSDWSGRTLSLLSSSQLTLQPADLEAALALRGWYDTIGQSLVRSGSIRNLSVGQGFGSGANDDSMQPSHVGMIFAPLEQRKTISQIRDENLHDKAEYIDIVATITFIKFDGMVVYAACPGTTEGNNTCQKKVVEVGPSLYRCEKCQRTYDTCNYRYVLSLHIADHTGQSWVNAFNEAGEQILGVPASEIVKLRESDLAAFDRVFKKANFSTWRFKLRGKQESYQGEMKLRLSVISLSSIPYATESNMILDYITAMTK